MGKLRFGLGLTLLLFACSLIGHNVMTSPTAEAAINAQINFQGKLTNLDGTNVADGTYSIVFSIYTVSSGGSAIWTETQPTVSVNDGIFNVALGSVTSLPGSVDFNTSSIYLGIKVGADAEMTPRVRFTASPYAFNSDTLDGLDSTNYVKLAQGIQSDSSTTNPSIAVNKTGGTAAILQLQKSGADVLSISNSGAYTYTLDATNNPAYTITNSGSGNIINNLAGTGDFLIQDNGVTIFTASDTGTITHKNSADSASAFLIQKAGSAVNVFVADTLNNRIYVGDPTADATGTLLVFDSKNTAGDPTGVNGGVYYNSSLGKLRCYENGLWADCTTSRIVGEATLGAATNSFTITLSASTDYLHCRLDVKSRSIASIPQVRFNSDAGAASYGWNIVGIVAAVGTDWQDASDSELQLSGTQTGTNPISADLHITNFIDTVKVIDWSAAGVENVGTNSNRYSGVGGWYNTTAQISSVTFFTSAGNLAAGTHGWCEGRNIP